MNNRELRSEYINSIKLLEFEKFDMRNFYTIHRFKGHYYKRRCADPLDFELETCQRLFNDTILKEMRKHPKIILDDKTMTDLEEKTKSITDRLPQDECLIMPYWNKFFKAMELCYNYYKRRYENG